MNIAEILRPASLTVAALRNFGADRSGWRRSAGDRERMADAAFGRRAAVCRRRPRESVRARAISSHPATSVGDLGTVLIGVAVVAVAVYLSYRFAARLITNLGETGPHEIVVSMFPAWSTEPRRNSARSG
jgi:hypothetical protein